MVLVLWILFECTDHRPFAHEPGDIIDMAVGIIACDTLLQPDNPEDAQVTAENLLEIRSGETRVPIFIEEALLGGHDHPPAVDIDRSPFENDPRAEPGQPQLSLMIEGTRSSPRSAGYLLPQALNVQSTMASLRPLPVHDEARSVVADPDIGIIHLVGHQVVWRGACSPGDQVLRFLQVIGIPDQEMDTVHARRRRR